MYSFTSSNCVASTHNLSMILVTSIRNVEPSETLRGAEGWRGELGFYAFWLIIIIINVGIIM